MHARTHTQHTHILQPSKGCQHKKKFVTSSSGMQSGEWSIDRKRTTKRVT